jgi:hypothetical protein
MAAADPGSYSQSAGAQGAYAGQGYSQNFGQQGYAGAQQYGQAGYGDAGANAGESGSASPAPGMPRLVPG